MAHSNPTPDALDDTLYCAAANCVANLVAHYGIRAERDAGGAYDTLVGAIFSAMSAGKEAHERAFRLQDRLAAALSPSPN